MAAGDPTDPTATDPTVVAPNTDQLEAWRSYNEYTAQSASNVDSLNNLTAISNRAFDTLNTGLEKLNMSFNSLDNMTSQQAAGFGALSTTILGSKEAFTQLANVDTTKLLTFTGQVKQMQEIFNQSPTYKLLKKELDDVTSSAAKMTDKIAAQGLVKAATEKFNELTKVVSDSAMAMLTSADNSLRLQNAMYQLTMQAGDSKDLFNGFGGVFGGMSQNFSNVGDVMAQFNKVLEHGSAALGGNQELAAKYMAEINKMPGGFKALIGPLTIAGTETDVLAASIQYATGAGRKQEEVFSDMSKAMAEYSISGGDALRFSSRISEVANSVGGQFKDVQSALHDVIGEFKMYVNSGADASKMTQGMSDSMRDYVSQLTSVGVPAQNAIEMFKNYSNQLKSMTIGQQSFVSTMSGGPGGLRGALQFQDDLAKGNFEKIQKQVEQTLKRTTGPLITREEGMKSEQGAAQYVRQLQVLQQGPLGGMAKTQGEADSLIRAMKEGKVFEPEKGDTPEKTLQDTMIKGQEWQKGSYTELTKINTNLQAMMLRGGTANLATTQGMFTAAGGRSIPGGSGTGAGISPGSQENLSASQRAINIAAPNSEVFKQTADAVKNLPKTFQDAWKSFKEAISGGNKESIQQANDKLLAAVKDAKATGNMTDKQKGSLDVLQNNLSVTKQDRGDAAPTTAGPTNAADRVTTPKMTFAPIENYARPGQRIPAPRQPATAAAGANNTAPGQQGGLQGQGAPGQQAVPVMLAPGSAITVNLTGVCPHCGKDINHTQANRGVSQGTSAP